MALVLSMRLILRRDARVVAGNPARELVGPARLTPRETKRPSDIDNHEALRFHVPVVLFYRHVGDGGDPVRLIRRALGEALVPYHPLAGRLREVEDRKLVVDCTGEGVLFVEADADTTGLGDMAKLRPPPAATPRQGHDLRRHRGVRLARPHGRVGDLAGRGD
ncbi:hypothetical protein HU200_015994 [Digitaria exilis]|uniref:Uncharacterized protein n=1 Tax=Digitaria exilis TaxID=1010633 RepID=A0A835F978_9POAL|nr:hypothetical protein HU200_015994 [Digitaria exilis]